MNSYLCRSCTTHFLRSQHRSSRRALSTQSQSLPGQTTTFSSFFFHNGSWTTRPSPSAPGRLVSLASVRAYREAEVLDARRLLKVYTQLSKSRLSILVVLTAMSGVALSPLPTTVPVLLATAIGTALCSASANTLNQMQEVPFDAQMARTRNRPLVRRAISPVHAAGFALATGVAGPALLLTMVNPTTAVLGVANIGLYAGLYTYLKRRSVFNTWVGAVVGAIPPLMGWAACGGNLLPSSQSFQVFLPSFLSNVPLDTYTGDTLLAPFALFMFLYSWQFPHFNSLSHLVRDSYAQAGYRMLCVTDPAKNALVCLRHALLLLPVCSILFPLSGLTTWAFALTSIVPNGICAVAAWRFWRAGGEKQARRVWQHSLWYLPVVLGLAMFHKRGMDWGSWIGLGSEEEGTEASA
ncbi:protoheme IX farnesyltransferase [Obba rivulosa]|uniref:Protoheme IX farnesyltransferase, mitochondrial n=1 Tax=Obba rivulosa TaxID=1052685 RepID=A0A8E2DSB1_9APHY|nr:protoheme IX farnesyltransferase [Obba rivulosa]